MPLTTWICDTCGGTIDNPGRAIVTWRDDHDLRAYEFLLVHKNIDGFNCDPGSLAGFSSSLDLDGLLGVDGAAWLLALLSAGPLKEPSDFMPRVKDFDGFVDLFRRLHTPWYEEARQRFNEGSVRDQLSDANEVLPYTERVLKAIAEDEM